MQSQIPEHQGSLLATAAVIVMILYAIYSMVKVWG
jgi:hypothetical protein